MQLEKISDGFPVNPPYVGANGVQYPPSIADAFTDAQLAQIGGRRRAAAPPTKDALKAYASQLRAAKEAVGVTVDVAADGQPAQLVPAATDVAGQMAIAGAVQLATLDPTRSFDWVTATGAVELTGAQIVKIGVAVGALVQATYTALGDVYAKIESGEIATTAAIDAYAWPGA